MATLVEALVVFAGGLGLLQYWSESESGSLPRASRRQRERAVGVVRVLLALAFAVLAVVDGGEPLVAVIEWATSAVGWEPRLPTDLVPQLCVFVVLAGDMFATTAVVRRMDIDWPDLGLLIVPANVILAAVVAVRIGDPSVLGAEGLLGVERRGDIATIAAVLAVVGAVAVIAELVGAIGGSGPWPLAGLALGTASVGLVLLAVAHENLYVVGEDVIRTPDGIRFVEGRVVSGWLALATFIAIGWVVGTIGLALAGAANRSSRDLPVFAHLGYCVGIVPAIWFVTYQASVNSLGWFGDVVVAFPSNWLPLTWFPALVAAVISYRAAR